MLKGRHGSGNKGNFETGQSKSKSVFLYIQTKRMQPFVSYHEHELQTFFQNGQYCVATYQ